MRRENRKNLISHFSPLTSHRGANRDAMARKCRGAPPHFYLQLFEVFISRLFIKDSLAKNQVIGKSGEGRAFEIVQVYLEQSRKMKRLNPYLDARVPVYGFLCQKQEKTLA